MVVRMRKFFSTINIETLLKQAEIDFSNENPLDNWLPLEFLEDKYLDILEVSESCRFNMQNIVLDLQIST